MITWIQKYFQRHFRTVFAVLLGITIISFILAINVSGGMGRDTGRQRESRLFFGVDLGSEAGNQQVFGDARLSLVLQLKPNNDNNTVEHYGLIRHTALWLADQLHLPAPTPAEMTSYIRSLPFFADPTTRQFDASRYQQFIDSLKTQPNLTEADVSRVCADDVRAEQLTTLLAGPGYVLPSDVNAAIALNDSTWSVALVNVDYASFNPPLNPTEDELTKFFADHPIVIPAQVRVDMIPFDAKSYLDQVKVTDAEVRKFYDDNPKAFPKPATPLLLIKPVDVAPNPDEDFAAVRPAVETAFKLDHARRLAENAAADLAVKLYQQKTTPATLDALLTANHLALKPLAPFSSSDSPAALEPDPENVAQAFQPAFNAEQPFSTELKTNDGAVILVWRESIASRNPPYAEVKDRVAADWKAAEKRRLFVAMGQTLHTRLAASLKAGVTLEQAVKDAADSTSSAKLEIKNYSGFTLEQKANAGSFDDLAHMLESMVTMQKGDLADMVVVTTGNTHTTPDKGELVYAVEKKIPDLSPSGIEFLLTKQRLEQGFAVYSADTVLGDLASAELAKTAPAKP